MFAKILVDVKSKNVDKMYDYHVPRKYETFLQVGARVVVPFGHRKVMGYCMAVSEEATYEYEIKDIERVIDLESYMNQELIDMALRLRKQTGYLLISVLETILPSALKVMYKPKIKLVNHNHLDEQLRPYFLRNDEVHLEYIPDHLYPMVSKEVKLKNLKQIYEIRKKNKSLSKQFVQLLVDEDQNLTAKQRLVYKYLSQKRDKLELKGILIARVNITNSVIKTMEKHQYIRLIDQEVYRDVQPIYQTKEKNVSLNDEQMQVFNCIKEHFNESKTFLLHGVTGSGKTEIYMKAIEEVISSGQSAILLVPEISLTPMMIQRFKSRFHNLVASLHSGLSSMEKYDEWRRIIKGEARIVIGARSACFAPLNNIGLFVVDESHESSYKQTDQLPYYAVDILKQRSITHQAPLILGSATPNIESYARASRGHYQLLTLKKRALNARMPSMKIVNMLEEFKLGNSGDISSLLKDSIQKRLNQNQQVILLINRRGYSNFVICRACGHVYKCQNCDISLTYHEHEHQLKCHYCDYTKAVPQTCEKCGSSDLEFMGSGTQKIEETLGKMFPNANIFRMDTDTTTKKHAHEKLLHQFQENGDILIGTQMIAKGLDFPRVTLVGVLQADGNLFVPDFRAPEKTFQLLMQVSGRSGRRDTLGEVIIQAYNPEHYAIKYAFNHDYIGFYEHEMRLRRIARYEPFYFLIELSLTGNSIKHVLVFGVQMVKDLRRGLSKNTIVLGPSSDIRKLNNKFTTTIMLKYKNEPGINDFLFSLIEKYTDKDLFIKVDHFPGVG